MTRSPFDPHDGMPEENDDTPNDAYDDGYDDASGDSAPADAFDELALRRLLHDAVRDIEPDDEALRRLFRDIAARRVRRRHAVVGAAASLLVIGAAVPALWHVSQFGGSDTAGTVNTSTSLTPGSSPGAPGDGRQGTPGRSFGQYPGGDGIFGSGPSSGSAYPRPSVPGTIGGSPVASVPPVVPPACERGQLGKGTARTDPADPDGRVYGSFQVTNVSASSCTVSGDSQISVTGQGSTDPGKIQVVDHTQGDPASALPDPASVPDAVYLSPGTAYQVRFAWIPAPGGGTTGCAADSPPPADGGTDAGTGTGGTDDSGGANAAESVSTDGGGTASDPPSAGGSSSPTPTPDGIALADVPPGGGPATATATISGACAGTVYRTDPQPAS